jgi:hypothetical protein
MNTYVVTVSICSLKDHYTLEVSATSEKDAIEKAKKLTGSPIHGCIQKVKSQLRRKVYYPRQSTISRKIKRAS